MYSTQNIRSWSSQQLMISRLWHGDYGGTLGSLLLKYLFREQAWSKLGRSSLLGRCVIMSLLVSSELPYSPLLCASQDESETLSTMSLSGSCYHTTTVALSLYLLCSTQTVLTSLSIAACCPKVRITVFGLTDPGTVAIKFRGWHQELFVHNFRVSCAAHINSSYLAVGNGPLLVAVTALTTPFC